MTSKPLISVIIAVYNGAKTLQRCIDSVSGQTYLNKEIIIIDGGSTDGTIEIITSNQEKITYWESEPDNGIYHAWNKALGHTTGNWICFLGSDDYFWKSSVFEEIIPSMIKAESLGIRMVYGQVARVTENDEISCIEGDSWEYTWRGIIIDGIGSFAHQGMFHHRSLFELYGKFDESFKIAGDYELLIRAFKEGGNAVFVNGLIVTGMQTGGITSNCVTLVKEIAKARQKNRLRVITIPWLISYSWAICYPFLNYLIGARYTRYLVNAGKYSISYLSYRKNAILERKNDL
jgi:glycosyltransferase involved in cell wall biosynthesis